MIRSFVCAQTFDCCVSPQQMVQADRLQLEVWGRGGGGETILSSRN